MRERVEETAIPLVVFTVLAQASVGVAFWGRLVPHREAGRAAPAIALALLAIGGVVVLLHLGRPGRAVLAAAHWRRSWLSREVLFGLAFGASLVVWLLAPPSRTQIVAASLAAVLGLLFVGAIAQVYRLRTVPAWDTWRTPALFFGTAVVVGASALPLALPWGESASQIRGLAQIAACFALVQALVAATSAAGRGAPHRNRLVLRLGLALVGSGILLYVAYGGGGGRPTWLLGLAAALLLASELLGRALFYESHRRVGL